MKEPKQTRKEILSQFDDFYYNNSREFRDIKTKEETSEPEPNRKQRERKN